MFIGNDTTEQFKRGLSEIRTPK